ncbi:unnamed protein product [Prorocentrum cordatum]|uniref:Uncharacterized protein n=1 Tax=Prorocentrum cordatum TaxID=2364126 RepID=A0ABN9T0Q2_9DINO|nr:unnamed protein product [Polarella glacialis]
MALRGLRAITVPLGIAALLAPAAAGPAACADAEEADDVGLLQSPEDRPASMATAAAAEDCSGGLFGPAGTAWGGCLRATRSPTSLLPRPPTSCFFATSTPRVLNPFPGTSFSS